MTNRWRASLSVALLLLLAGCRGNRGEEAIPSTLAPEGSGTQTTAQEPVTPTGLATTSSPDSPPSTDLQSEALNTSHLETPVYTEPDAPSTNQVATTTTTPAATTTTPAAPTTTLAPLRGLRYEPVFADVREVLDWDGSLAVNLRDWTPDGGRLNQLLSFGVDNRGKVYVLTVDDVLRIVPVR